MGRYSAGMLKEKLGYPDTEPSTYNLSHLQDELKKLWHKTHGVFQPMCDLTGDLLHKRESMPYSAWMIRNKRLDNLG